MNVDGLESITLADYERFRSGQVSLANIEPTKDYQLVSRIASSEINAALIDTYNLSVYQEASGRLALRAMLLRNELTLGVRPFNAYECPDEYDRPILIPSSGEPLQLYTPRTGRLYVSEGFLIGRDPQPVNVLEQPERLIAHAQPELPLP